MKILWVKTELLHPLDKGGKIRTFHMLRELKRVHHVTYLTLDDGRGAPDALERAAEYCHEVVRIRFRAQEKRSPGFYAELVGNLASPLPYAVAKYRSAAMRREIGARVATGDVDVLVCDFLFPSVNIPDDLGCPAVLFQHNVEALIWKRHWGLARDPVSRGYLRAQWRRIRAFEARECRRYDHVVVVSPEDRELVSREYDVRRVSEVPTGVDTEYFRSSGKGPRDPHNMVFTGSMDWIPNEDAVRFCVQEILPRIRQAVPDATLTVLERSLGGAGFNCVSSSDPKQALAIVDLGHPFCHTAECGTKIKLLQRLAILDVARDLPGEHDQRR